VVNLPRDEIAEGLIVVRKVLEIQVHLVEGSLTTLGLLKLFEIFV
jgi:hypothetical protein